jgi:4-amino-4-deoxy-L-arabinose transferase-like glycosyltransferase
MPLNQARPKAESRHSRFLAGTLVVSALGVVLSALFVILLRQDVIRSDETYYLPLAQRILSGSYDDGYIIRPPLYPLFLAALLKIFGLALKPALLVQSVLGGGLVYLVSFIGMRQGFALAGLVTALLVAICPDIIFTYSRFLSEVIYLPVFILSFYLLDNALRSERSGDTVGAGAAFGVAALVRSVSLFLGIFLAGWFVIRRSREGRFSRSSLKSAALFLVTMFIVITPWTVRNAVVHGGFIPTGTSGAFNLYYLTSGSPYLEAMAEWSSWGSQPERQREGLRRWRDYLKGDPTFHLRQLITRTREVKAVFPALLGQPQWQDPPEPRKPGADSTTPFKYSETFAGIWDSVRTCWAWLVLGLGILGLVKFEESRRRNLILAILIFLYVFHTTTIAKPRLFIPASVLLALPAGRVLALGLRRLRPAATSYISLARRPRL